jgi:hypothetical protein
MKALSKNEFVGGFQGIRTVVIGKLPDDTVAQVHVEDVVIGARREHTVALVLLAVSVYRGRGVHNVADLIPLAVLEGVGFGRGTVLENLNFTFFALHIAHFVNSWKGFHVNLFAQFLGFTLIGVLLKGIREVGTS